MFLKEKGLLKEKALKYSLFYKASIKYKIICCLSLKSYFKIFICTDACFSEDESTFSAFFILRGH